jgi:CheY-like chemotaxis protein
VSWATNAADAAELLRVQSFDIVLLDEQMPGKRGSRRTASCASSPHVPMVMVTKSEEDATLKDALGGGIQDYLVKPVNPRQILTVVTRLLEGPRSGSRRWRAPSSTASARSSSSASARSLARVGGPLRRADAVGRGPRRAGEMGLHESLRGLYPDMHREFAEYMREAYPAWLADLERRPARRSRSTS